MTVIRLTLRGLLPLVLLSACAVGQEPFDFDAACKMADAPASTPAELRRIADTITHASNGNFQPKGDRVAPYRAALLLAEAARKAAAPYALPSEFQGNLPKRPDTTEVRGLQSELGAACK